MESMKMGSMKVEKEPEVGIALDEQKEELALLSKLIEDVAGRFSRVLRAGPVSTIKEKERLDSSVPLVNEIRHNTHKVEVANTRLKSLMGLCEL